MRRGWVIAIAVLGLVGILFAVVFIVGNNGVQNTEWRAFKPESMVKAENAEFVSVSGGTLSSENCELLPEYEGRQNVVRLATGGTVSCVLNAPRAGAYGLKIGYHTVSGKGMDMEYALSVDGKPYSSANTVVSLNRIWTDQGQPERTATGNDLRPKQVEAYLWTEALLADTNEVEGRVILDLDAGDHTVELKALREETVLDYMALAADEALPSYEEYAAAHQFFTVFATRYTAFFDRPVHRPVSMALTKLHADVICLAPPVLHLLLPVVFGHRRKASATAAAATQVCVKKAISGGCKCADGMRHGYHIREPGIKVHQVSGC